MAGQTSARRRVVVTGLGVISSIGLGAKEFARALREGRSGARTITGFDTSGFEHTTACEVTDFHPEELLHRLVPADTGRASQLAAVAARLAVEDAGLAAEEVRRRRSLIAVGTLSGGADEIGMSVREQLAAGTGAVDRGRARRARSGRLSADIAQELGLLSTEAVTVPTACAAGNYAIGYGFDAVAAGEVELALCGGADALVRNIFVGFYRLGTIAPDVCRPFDKGRQGILTGEGSAVLVLESLDSALARGARVYAEVLGHGLVCEAHHPVAPDRDSMAACMSRAHANAGITADQVDLISAHGTGTLANDATEASAIHQVFGDSPPPVTALKSMLGHCMGASSALSAAACAIALDEGFIPPTINHIETDPEIEIDCVPNTARAADLRIVQNNALAFGGNDAVLLMGRIDREVRP